MFAMMTDDAASARWRVTGLRVPAACRAAELRRCLSLKDLDPAHEAKALVRRSITDQLGIGPVTRQSVSSATTSSTAVDCHR
jgi:hypothetical protein